MMKNLRWRIGLILVNINPAYRLSELEFSLNKVGCKALVVAPSFKSSNYLQMLSELAPELLGSGGHLNSARLPALRAIIAMSDSPPPGFLSDDATFPRR